jgi:PLP dependent protein
MTLDEQSDSITERVVEVQARVDSSTLASGRTLGSVKLIAATKTVPVANILTAIKAGITDLGENRAQELTTKAPAIAAHSELHWHFIGSLQRNKVKVLAPWVTLWHSIDRIELGETIARFAPKARVLIEVNVAAEPNKSGCEVTEAPSLVDALRDQGLAVAGLMAIPPPRSNESDPIRHFAALRILAESLDLTELSMGMTDDYELAISEGATMVRVGRGLFGDRPPEHPLRR